MCLYLVFNVPSRREKGTHIFFLYSIAVLLFYLHFPNLICSSLFYSVLFYLFYFTFSFVLFYLGERWTTIEWNRFPGQQLRWKGISIIYLFCHDLLSFFLILKVFYLLRSSMYFYLLRNKSIGSDVKTFYLQLFQGFFLY